MQMSYKVPPIGREGLHHLAFSTSCILSVYLLVVNRIEKQSTFCLLSMKKPTQQQYLVLIINLIENYLQTIEKHPNCACIITCLIDIKCFTVH